MKEWHNLLRDILANGITRPSRAGPTKSVFGRTLRWDLSKGFPAVTTKKLHFNSVAEELAGFLRAEQDASKMGSQIWLANAKAWTGPESQSETDMGRIYGVQWRQWEGWIDQLYDVTKRIWTDPYDRRHLVIAWNPGELDKMCLPPCHYAFQFYVANDKLSCMFQMRSVDCFLGLPFDIASYALLTHIIAQGVGLSLGDLVANLADTHIYLNHFTAVETVLQRECYTLPRLLLNELATIDNFESSMARLVDYVHHPTVKAVLNV